MKKLLLSTFVFLAAYSLQAQTNTFPSSGNVGIGISNPTDPLHIYESIGGSTLRLDAAINKNPNVIFSSDGNSLGNIRIADSEQDQMQFGVMDGSIWNYAMSISKQGNVGIGTSNPTDPLHIYEPVGSSGSTLRLDAAINWNPNLLFSSDGKDLGNIRIADHDQDQMEFGVLNGTSWIYALSISKQGNVGMLGNVDIKGDVGMLGNVDIKGNVGIGTANPLDALHIYEPVGGSGTTLRLDAAINWNPNVLFSSDGKDLGNIRIADDDQDQMQFGVLNGTSWIYAMSISKQGNVGIGTAVPDAPLTVKGNIHAREIKVTATAGGADFVFADDYSLPGLEEVEAFVKANKHLPEIPSAAEMEANGLHLAEMNIKLLQKVEELTLYLIDMDKQIQELKAENKELRGGIAK